MQAGVYTVNDEVDDVARRAKLPGFALGGEDGKQVLVGVAQIFAVVVGEAVHLLQKQVQGFAVAVGQKGALEHIAKQLGDEGVVRHALQRPHVQVQPLDTRELFIHQFRPGKALVAIIEKGRFAAQLH